MKKPRANGAVLIVMLGLVVGLLAPGSAAARGCATENAHPIYSLSVFNDARCGVGSVVARRLAQRYDAANDFSGQASRSFVYQQDAQGRRWKCQWNNVGDDSDVVAWYCGRRSSLISWIWHAERPTA